MYNIWKEFSVSFSSCKQERKWQFLFSWFSNFTQYSFWISKLPVDRPNSFTSNNQHLIVYTHLNVLFDQKIYNSMVVELEKSLHLWDTSKMAPVSWPVTSFNFRRPPFRSIMSASSDTKRDFVSSELGTKE